VILVHRGEKLFNNAYPDKFRDDVARRLKSKNITVILGDSIENPADLKAPTQKGASLNADLILVANGGRTNNEWIAQSLGKNVLSERGLVNVKSTLQVQGYNQIYAMGDMIEWVEQKQSLKYYYHGPVVTKNVMDSIQGRRPTVEYKGMSEMIFLSIGRVRA